MRITLATVLTLVVAALVAPPATAAGPELVLTMVEAADRCAPAGTTVQAPTVVATRGGEPVSGLEVKWSTFRADGDLRNVGAVTGADGRSTAPFDAVTLGDPVEFYVRAVDAEWHRFRDATATVRAIGGDRSPGTLSADSSVHYSDLLYVHVSAPGELGAAADGTCLRTPSAGAYVDLSARPRDDDAATASSLGRMVLDGTWYGASSDPQMPGVGTWILEAETHASDGTLIATRTRQVEVVQDELHLELSSARSRWGRDGSIFLHPGRGISVTIGRNDPRSATADTQGPASLEISFTDAVTHARRSLPDAIVRRAGGSLVAVIKAPPTRRGRLEVSYAGDATTAATQLTQDIRPMPTYSWPTRVTRVKHGHTLRRTVHFRGASGLKARLVMIEKGDWRTQWIGPKRIPASGNVTLRIPDIPGNWVVRAETIDSDPGDRSYTVITSTRHRWTIIRGS